MRRSTDNHPLRRAYNDGFGHGLFVGASVASLVLLSVWVLWGGP